VFEGTKLSSPNHVLINEYRPGEGIMPHEDGAAYEPIVATISLGGSTVLEIFEKETDNVDSEVTMDSNKASSEDELSSSPNIKVPKWRILQESGSLLVTKGEAYKVLLHGISPIAIDRDLGPNSVANWSLLGNQDAFHSGVNERETRVSLTYREVIKTARFFFGR
jgi:alkylated DNA repair protein alkB homolog 6